MHISERSKLYYLASGNKRPAENFKEAMPHERTNPPKLLKPVPWPKPTPQAPAQQVSSKPPVPVQQPEKPKSARELSLDLLNKLKMIVKQEFPSVYNEFDFEILERGII